MENEEMDLAGEFGANAPSTVEQVQPVEQQPEPVARETPEQIEARSGQNRIPLSEHLSVRERAQKAEQRAAELERQLQSREPKQAPAKRGWDWEAPEQGVQEIARQEMEAAREEMNPIRESLMFNSRLVAQQVHGADVMAKAEKAFNDAWNNGEMDPATNQRINRSPNPFHAAVEWFKQQEVLKTVGSDLSAYETKLLDEKLKDPEFLARAVAAHQAAQQSRHPNGQFGAKPTNVTRLPPSLTRAVGASSMPAGDISDEDMARAFGAS